MLAKVILKTRSLFFITFLTKPIKYNQNRNASSPISLKPLSDFVPFSRYYILVTPQISHRGKDLPVSPNLYLTSFADQAKTDGKKIYHFNILQTDMETP